MKLTLLAMFALAVGILAVPLASANEYCEVTTTVKVSGLIAATDINICANYREEYGEVGDLGNVGFHVSVPNAASTPVITITPGTPSGCTLGTATTRSISGTAGASGSYFNLYTATDTTCVVSARIQVSLSSTPVFDEDFSVGAHCTCAQQKNLLSGGVTVTDDANGWAIVNSGSIANTLSGTVNTVNSGSVTNTLTGTVNAVNSGTVNTVNSGTLAVTNSGTITLAGGLALTGTLTVHQDPITGQLKLCGQSGACGVIQTTTNSTVTIGTAAINETTNQNLNVAVANVVTDFWFPIIFWASLFVACWRQGWTYAMWAAFPGIINTLLPTLFPAPLNDLATLLMLFLAGVILEFWAARGKQDGTWSN